MGKAGGFGIRLFPYLFISFNPPSNSQDKYLRVPSRLWVSPGAFAAPLKLSFYNEPLYAAKPLLRLPAPRGLHYSAVMY
jgi:hypothetical protein